jgi:hypothetical protein
MGNAISVKYGDVVAIMLEMLDAAGELRGRLQQVGDDDDEAALLEHLGRFVERLLDVARAGRFNFFHLKEDGAERFRAGDGGEAFRDRVGEEGERGRIALADEHVHQAGGEGAGVLEFRDRAGLAKVEAGGGIDEDGGAQAGLVLEAADHVPIRFREDLPVDQVGRVAFDVVAVLGELDRSAKVGRAVQALDAALHRPSRGNAEAANLVRHAGREIFRCARGGHGEAVTKFPNLPN